MKTLEQPRPRITASSLIETTDRIQRAVQHAAIRMRDFSVGDATPWLQEAGAHSQALAAMVRTIVGKLEALAGRMLVEITRSKDKRTEIVLEDC